MTGANAKIKRIYVGDKQVRPSGWTPGANTLFYASFKNDKNAQGTLGYTINQGESAIIDNSLYVQTNNWQEYSGGTYQQMDFTLSIWMKKVSGNESIRFSLGREDNYPSFYTKGWTARVGIDANSNYPYFVYVTTNMSNAYDAPSSIRSSNTVNVGTWNNMILTKEGKVFKLYVNGTLSASRTSSYSNIRLSEYINVSGGPAYYSEAICENKAWTATEVLNYYNKTKSNYGL